MFVACGRRCAFEVENVAEKKRVIDLLEARGFVIACSSTAEIAISYVGVGTYLRGASLAQAPEFFDCSSFTKWVFAQRGIWIPRRTIQQISYGARIEIDDCHPGDLIFRTGARNYTTEEMKEGVGHVGILVAPQLVAHAANARAGITVTSLNKFHHDGKILRGVRRIVRDEALTLTFDCPAFWEVETSDDLVWIIRQLEHAK